MATIVKHLSLDQWVEEMGKLGDNFMSSVMKGVRSGGKRCVSIMQEKTEQAPKASERGTIGAVNFGAYKQAWKVTPISDGVEVSNDRPYSGVIEFGRRQAPVNKEGITNLELWVKRKLKLSDSEAKSAAFAIARSLNGKGEKAHMLKPRSVMTNGLDEMIKAIMDEIDFELTKALAGK